MIALLQRVNFADITVDGSCIASMKNGVLAFIAFEKGDTAEKSRRMLDRILKYRIFSDSEGKMNLNVNEAGGNLMLVSQFTLAADTDRGNRPSFDPAMPPQETIRRSAVQVWSPLLRRKAEPSYRAPVISVPSRRRMFLRARAKRSTSTTLFAWSE